jgi:hypothetical protein
MGVFKQFLASDIIVSPLEVNKAFTFTGAAELTGSNVSIDRFLGTNLSGTLFDPTTDPTTGQVSTQYQRLIYSSIQELYYSNYTNASSSYGAPYATASIIPGSDPSGDVLSGSISSAGKYFNYPQTDLTFAKYFSTASNATIGVISIPSRLYGNYIQPNSFIMTAPSGSINDDGQGNLINTGTGEICGNIFYPHGIAVITSDGSPNVGASLYGSAVYGTSAYGAGSDASYIQSFVTASNVTCSFSSSLTIYETQYKCTLRENEFNASLNPSIQSGSDGTIYNFATGSEFGPYVTTVGLYDEDQNLLAVGKLAQPVPSSPTTDTTILINIDR